MSETTHLNLKRKGTKRNKKKIKYEKHCILVIWSTSRVSASGETPVDNQNLVKIRTPISVPEMEKSPLDQESIYFNKPSLNFRDISTQNIQTLVSSENICLWTDSAGRLL